MKKIIFVLIFMFMFLVNVNAGSITVKRIDSDSKERLEATLEGSSIELYEYGCRIDNKVIDENGMVVFDNLENGVYGIKQGRATGYEFDIYTTEVYLYGEFTDKTITLKSHVIESNLIINKYIGDVIDKDAVFEVYHNGNLIKILKYENGKISGKLEYGTYLIKQVNGSKFYDYIDDFTVTISTINDYKFDLYSDMDSELKLFFEGKENSLSIRESELLKKENDLNEVEEKLKKREFELNEKEKQIKQKEEELISLKNNIKIKEDEIKNNSIMLNKRIDELNKKENELIDLKNNLDTDKDSLINLEGIINKEREEITILRQSLNKKINELEEEKLSLKNKEEKYQEEFLVVEVPNTSKKSYNKYISISLIILGSLLIVYKIKKLLI